MAKAYSRNSTRYTGYMDENPLILISFSVPRASFLFAQQSVVLKERPIGTKKNMFSLTCCDPLRHSIFFCFLPAVLQRMCKSSIDLHLIRFSLGYGQMKSIVRGRIRRCCISLEDIILRNPSSWEEKSECDYWIIPGITYMRLLSLYGYIHLCKVVARNWQ